MNTRFPASLVQIHYHNRFGGVGTVMSTYSDCFRSIAGAAAPNLWICKSEERRLDSTPQCIDLTDAAYHTFQSKASFDRMAERLTRKLLFILQSSAIKLPVAVIGHNLNLGKNPALTAAFNLCAKQLSGATADYRFFSMMHDLVEDGRSMLMEKMRRIESWGVDIFGILYSHKMPVHFIVPNTTIATLSTLSERLISAIPNCTPGVSDVKKRLPGRHKVYERLQRYASDNACTIASTKPLFCYPSRIIYRKNIYEALLLTTILAQGTLITGAVGTSPGDRRCEETLLTLARRYNLSFVYNVSKIFTDETKDATSDRSHFAPFYPIVTAVVSTSRAEGFGFSLTEPWLYGAMVIGRQPSGTSYVPGMKLPSLYMRLPIPASWVSINEMYQQYTEAYRRTWGNERLSFKQFSLRFAISETVDFGMLSETQQIAVIKRLCNNDGARVTLTEFLQKRSEGWPGLSTVCSVDKKIVDHNRKCITRWSGEGFLKQFCRCLLLPRHSMVKRRWFENLAMYYKKSVHFCPHERV